jgi:hypothetical protein
MEFQRGISVKRKLDSTIRNCVGIALFRPFKQIPPNIKFFLQLYTHVQQVVWNTFSFESVV